MAVPAPKHGSDRNYPSAGGTALDALKSDLADLTFTYRGLYVGVGGNVKLTMEDGDALTFVGLAAGVVYPLKFYRVWSSGTTATSLIGLH